MCKKKNFFFVGFMRSIHCVIIRSEVKQSNSIKSFIHFDYCWTWTNYREIEYRLQREKKQQKKKSKIKNRIQLNGWKEQSSKYSGKKQRRNKFKFQIILLIWHINLTYKVECQWYLWTTVLILDNRLPLMSLCHMVNQHLYL